MKPFTFVLPPEQWQQLTEYAEAQGFTTGECLRRIITEKFAQLQRGEEST